jgi:hypothetical protein
MQLAKEQFFVKPTLFVGRIPDIFLDELPRYKKQFPNAIIETIPNAGHLAAPKISNSIKTMLFLV